MNGEPLVVRKRRFVLLAFGGSHLGIGVAFSDEPGGDARRYVTNRAWRQPAEGNPVYFAFERSFPDSNLQQTYLG